MSAELHLPDDRHFSNEQFMIAAQTPDALAAFWTELEELEDQNLGKSPTLTIDREGQSTLEEPAQIAEKPKYVQGIVQGKQVYLITNLISNVSQTFRQSQSVWTIGRNRSASIALQDRKLSRRHAVILYVPEEGFYLIDLNSMNGSYVNGVRVQQRQSLHDGDWVCVGSTRFFFFASVREKLLEAIHSEVLTRLNNVEARSTPFIDFSELNEEISFKVAQVD